MKHLNDYADDRLIQGCIYCGGPPETRDHVPSRCLLDRPYPANLPVVGCCETCNQGFSKDEQYFVCLIESVLCGSTDPDLVGRSSVANRLRKSPKLRARIEAARIEDDSQIAFAVESDRVSKVMLKLARGHAAFELSQPCRKAPDHFWWGPLSSLTPPNREKFESPVLQLAFGEIGSRSFQRLFETNGSIFSKAMEGQQSFGLLNNWVEVKVGQYRYLAIDDGSSLLVRVAVAEYLGCEALWRLSEGLN